MFLLVSLYLKDTQICGTKECGINGCQFTFEFENISLSFSKYDNYSAFFPIFASLVVFNSAFSEI